LRAVAQPWPGGCGMSELRGTLEDYLAIRRSLGFKLVRAGLLLANFAAYAEHTGTDIVTTELAFAWATLPPGGDRAWWAHRRRGWIVDSSGHSSRRNKSDRARGCCASDTPGRWLSRINGQYGGPSAIPPGVVRSMGFTPRHGVMGSPHLQR